MHIAITALLLILAVAVLVAVDLPVAGRLVRSQVSARVFSRRKIAHVPPKNRVAAVMLRMVRISAADVDVETVNTSYTPATWNIEWVAGEPMVSMLDIDEPPPVKKKAAPKAMKKPAKRKTAVRKPRKPKK